MSCQQMSGLYATRQAAAAAASLGQELRRLRADAGCPGREVAAAAEIDSGLLSKIENGKRLPTQKQLAAMAKFFGAPLAALETRRLAEEMKRQFGSSPQFVAATTLLQEEAGEYRPKKIPPTSSKYRATANKQTKTQ